MNPNIGKILGIALIIVSFVLWGIIVALPFLGLKAGVIAGATTALVILGEITFWLGILLAGRPAWERIKGFFWRKKI